MTYKTCENKEELLRCALHLFARRGYDGTSTQEIVEMAGLSKPTLYHYFGSKEGILIGIVDEHYVRFLRALEQAGNLPEDISLTIYRLIKVYFETALKYPDFYQFRAGMNMRTGEDEAYKIFYASMLREAEIIRNFFEAASLQAGNLRGKEILCSTTFVGMIDSVVSAYMHTQDESLLSDEVIYRLRQQFLHGIYS